MYNVGDLIVYSAHGICKIDDICEKTISGITQTYYVLHPLEDDRLTISTPVHNEKVVMLELADSEEALDIMESFKHPGVEWDDKHNSRRNAYSEIVHKGERKEIAKVVNTLLRKKIDAEIHERKLYEQDLKLLNDTQNILFNELAIALNTTTHTIEEMVKKSIKGSPDFSLTNH